jgi:hypothetical protein
MWTEGASFPGIIVVKAGIIDDGGLAKVTPSSESFTCRKPGWVTPVDGAKQFEKAFKQ